ncbi:MAG: molybdenum cofactor biosynthesis protein MoaB [Rhodothermaceae bacterium]|nr:molybdenum cofactor biosynthesis protein MoaB [Rhodothermaceae bacterium]
MSSAEHERLAKATPVTCAVVTVSDTRTEDTDTSGKLLIERLTDAGHTVRTYRIVPDDAEVIRTVLVKQAGRVEVVITTGGTGIAHRDTTVEVAETLIAKSLPGFGELFRMLSYEEIGPAAMLSRAMAGVYGPEASTLLFCCPGSSNAVTLATDRLIVPQLPHLVWELLRQR